LTSERFPAPALLLYLRGHLGRDPGLQQDVEHVVLVDPEVVEDAPRDPGQHLECVATEAHEGAHLRGAVLEPPREVCAGAGLLWGGAVLGLGRLAGHACGEVVATPKNKYNESV